MQNAQAMALCKQYDSMRNEPVNIPKTLLLLAFGAVLLAGCNAHKDQPAAESAAPVEPATTPAPSDTTMPSDQADPAMGNDLPTDPKPPPQEVPPPNG